MNTKEIVEAFQEVSNPISREYKTTVDGVDLVVEIDRSGVRIAAQIRKPEFNEPNYSWATVARKIGPSAVSADEIADALVKVADEVNTYRAALEHKMGGTYWQAVENGEI